MSVLRVALAQVGLVVGDLAGNAGLVLDRSRQAAAAGAQLVVFPEMTLTGYPPEDLVLRRSVRQASTRRLAALAGELATAGLGRLGVVVGYLDDSRPDRADGEPRNAAAFLQDGRVVARYFKHHLPNYGVFDEDRYFTAGESLTVVRFGGVDVGLTVCEDVWQDGGPFAAAGRAGVGLLVNINGSPYESGKEGVRLELVRSRAIEAGAAVVYVNQVGGQDELVFDGGSFVVAADGSLLARAPQFVEDLYYVELTLPDADPADHAEPVHSGLPGDAGLPVVRVPAPLEPPGPARLATPLGIAGQPDEHAVIWQALVTGTRDYAVKNRFGTVVLGMSGGIDSAVVAAIAADAIGGDNVHGAGMPSAYSSGHSLSDAEDLADRIGAHYQVIPIADMVEAFLANVKLTGLAEENLQARVRGTVLMGLSNQHGHLVLATGNKSELSVGYSTIYGDAVGGFAPIKDVPKSLVWQLARWRNAEAVRRGEVPPIPESSISKAPSAELRPGQLDSDSLPDYELLDRLLARYVDADVDAADLLAEGFDPDLVTRVVRMTDAAEWKRRQYPPGPKISLKAFGKDRRLPVTNRWREDPAG